MTPSRLAAFTATALAVVGCALGVALDLAGAGAPLTEWLFTTVFLFFAVVGALLAVRCPENPVGWLLLAIGFLECVFEAAFGAYGQVGSQRSWAGHLWATALADAADSTGPGFGTLLLLLFPTGRSLPGRRWWLALRVTIVWMVAAALTAMLVPFEIGTTWSERNETVMTATPVVLLFGVVAMVVRFRRSHGSVRQQIKWVSYAAVLLFIGVGLSTLGWTTGLAERVGDALFVFPTLLGLVSMPLAIGIAILRHGLFDIDRLISRTASYALITALLATSYVGVVLALSAAARAAGASSDLAVAVSTLVVAALFQPVRTRVQELVDRRFNRRRYDAARTVAAFGAELRREVRLDRLATDLQQVVAASVLPRHSSVWMLPETRR